MGRRREPDLEQGSGGVEDLAERCVATLRHRPAGLLTDIDGTISTIAPTPDAAYVDDMAREALRRLIGCIEVVGTVSGRSAADSSALLAVDGLIFIGNHGMETLRQGVTETVAAAEHAASSVAHALADIEAASLLVEGLLFENKGVTASIHYRLARDPERARDSLLQTALDASVRHGLRLTEGRMVIELRPPIAVNKGTALRSIAASAGLASLLFFGDDLTDVDGFAAIRDLRRSSGLKGLNIAVVSPESSPLVAQAADAAVHGVAECVALLDQIANRLADAGAATTGA